MSPLSEEDVVALVRAAQAPVSIVGGGTLRGVGRPAQAAGSIATHGLTGVTLYEPAEMVIAARAGTPLADVEATLAAQGQMLAFEPGDWRGLMGTQGAPTIGGVVATNRSGPRRIAAGACRDSLIGIRMVNGRGEAIGSGGRVMKNVTGLDLVKLVCGAWGTLGVLTEVTFKVSPRPETAATLELTGLDAARAVAALSAGLGSPFEVTGAAHLPEETAEGPARTLLRIEGFAASVDYRCGRLTQQLAPFGAALRRGPEESALLWRAIADAAPVSEPREDAVWRISARPSAAPSLLAAIRSALPRPPRALLDWGGGLIWLSCAAQGDAGACAIRAALREVAAGDGHATLVRAPEAVRAATDVFQPLAEPILALHRRIKASFDPNGLFEPGRMHAGA